jgi:hypothetical protein
VIRNSKIQYCILKILKIIFVKFRLISSSYLSEVDLYLIIFQLQCCASIFIQLVLHVWAISYFLILPFWQYFVKNKNCGVIHCVKVKLSCAELIKHYTVKAYGGVDIEIHIVCFYLILLFLLAVLLAVFVGKVSFFDICITISEWFRFGTKDFLVFNSYLMMVTLTTLNIMVRNLDLFVYLATLCQLPRLYTVKWQIPIDRSRYQRYL